MSTVHVVFCMDTEGPCDDPVNVEILKNWQQVDLAMDKLFSEDFRYRFPDSYDSNFKIGWFFLAWTGFNPEKNPRKRDLGYHKVLDHYRSRWGRLIETYGDEECWHYHHPPKSGIANEWSDDWSSSSEYKNIISKQIIERNWFPICFRAGGTIMDKHLSRWLDAWFPFDYSNRSPLKSDLMDWEKGISEWRAYNPDIDLYKTEGTGKRYLARTMDLLTGIYEAGEKDILQAFVEAKENGSSVLSIFDHDYRDIEERINNFMNTFVKISAQFPEIKWKYSSPSDAIIETQSLSNTEDLKISAVCNDNVIKISVSTAIHQEYPWIAVKDSKGIIYQLESNLNKTSNTSWELEIPDEHNYKEIGIGATNKSGYSDTKVISL